MSGRLVSVSRKHARLRVPEEEAVMESRNQGSVQDMQHDEQLA